MKKWLIAFTMLLLFSCGSGVAPTQNSVMDGRSLTLTAKFDRHKIMEYVDRSRGNVCYLVESPSSGTTYTADVVSISCVVGE